MLGISLFEKEAPNVFPSRFAQQRNQDDYSLLNVLASQNDSLCGQESSQLSSYVEGGFHCCLELSLAKRGSLEQDLFTWALLLFGARSFSVMEPVLPFAGRSAASLTSTLWMPEAHPLSLIVTFKTVSRYHQCPLGGRNPFPLPVRTTALALLGSLKLFFLCHS